MHLISVKDITKEFLVSVFQDTDDLKSKVERNVVIDVMKTRILATVFYEPSTRTSSSFQSAMLRLGGSVLPINTSFSSVSKGESLRDTMRTLSCYANCIVLRHPEQGAASQAYAALNGFSDVPVINAGDGAGEHPTQAILDMYTLQSEIRAHGKDFSNLTVTLVGDLKNGRTVHSLMYLLSLYDIKKINLVSPDSLKMPESICMMMSDATLATEVCQIRNLEDVVFESDVIYMTRIQKERFENPNEYENVKSAYCLDAAMLKSFKAKDSLVIMHPLPRVDEISIDVDDDPRAVYFRQVKNGMYVRMAILCKCMNVEV